MLIRSRIVLPISGPPIENGAVAIVNDRIVSVGSWNDLRTSNFGEVFDLGESILLPGLVNAHCHLDYTSMAGMIPSARNFPDWVKAILALKSTFTFSDYAESWIIGAKQLLRSGTTTVADIEAVPELLPDVWTTTPLRVLSFLELTSVRSGRGSREVIGEAVAKIEATQDARNRVLLSPHALYSTNAELVRDAAVLCKERHWPMTTHVSESEPELEMYTKRSGLLFDWLKNQRDLSDCGDISPIAQLQRCGALSPNFLAVHVNYIRPGDAELLAKSGSSVVHCPRSHAYFNHRPFPYNELRAAGVNVCLGTDSLASVIVSRSRPTELNMFAEMRRFAEVNPNVRPEVILKMATLNGAKALGMSGQIAEIAAGAKADLISVPFSGNVNDAVAGLLQLDYPERITIDGRWI